MANEKRLIDANALKERAIHVSTVKGLGNKERCCIKAVGTHEIDEAPTVDAVEVVRCKDCKKGRPIDKSKRPEKYFRADCVVCECEDVVGNEPMIYEPMHYCSYGDRKDGAAP